MIRGKMAATFGALTACVLMTGCMPKMTIEDMKAMTPKRPAELDHLNMFVGKWQYEGTMEFGGSEESIKSTGTSDTEWGPGKWYLLSDSLWNMEGFDPMHGHEVWTYDVKAKKFRSVWTDTMGAMGYGTSKYNPETKTWKMHAVSHGPMGKSTMNGTVTFVDDNTMKFEAKEKAMFGLVTVMEWEGTATRK